MSPSNHIAIVVVTTEPVTTILLKVRLYSLERCAVFTYPTQVAIQSDMPREFHWLVVSGLTTLLMREVVTLHVARLRAPGLGRAEGTGPHVLLCLALAALICSETSMASGTPWEHAMPPGGGGGLVEPWRPVCTGRYMEWLISVPVLLLLAGHCALGRPLSEVAGPIAVTDAYVLLGWVAMVVDTPLLRWSVVLASFLGYGHACRGMWRWLQAYLKEVPADAPSRTRWMSALVMLMVIFAAHAAIYLATLAGVVSSYTENLTYSILGCGAKVTMCVIFTTIRASDQRQQLDALLCKVGHQNTTLMSLLRGSFDTVLLCSATRGGSCTLTPSAASAEELAEAEAFLGRPLAGVQMSSVLAGPQERERFMVYVRNTLRQTESFFSGERMDSLPLLAGDLSGARRTPLAQMLHCKMLRTGASGDSLVSTVIYLSAIPRRRMSGSGQPTQLVAALRFEEIVPLRPESPTRMPPADWRSGPGLQPLHKADPEERRLDVAGDCGPSHAMPKRRAAKGGAPGGKAAVKVRAHKQLEKQAPLPGRSRNALLSQLRSSFDVVLPCLAASDGGCKIPSGASPDVLKLSEILGQHVDGIRMSRLLAGPEERQRFKEHVQKTLRQVYPISEDPEMPLQGLRSS